MNSSMISGRITRDPEVKVTSGGVSVCSFTIAVRRNYKNPQGEYESDFIPCVAYRSKADYVGKNAKKGDFLEVAGKLRQYKYETERGEKRSGLEIAIGSDGEVNIVAKKKAAEYEEAATLDECEPLDNIPF